MRALPNLETPQWILNNQTTYYVVWLFVLILILQGTVTLAQNSKPLRPKSSHAFFDPDAIRHIHALHTAGLQHDRSQLPVLHDEDKWIAYYADQVYPGVKAGLPWKWRIGY